jgi:ABC-type branched-subunit amino acid transport system ATPase component
MASLELDNIVRHFGSVEVIPSFNLQVEDGEFVVRVGPSSCGKSTFMRMIAGREVPDSGAIRIGRRLVTNVAPKDRDVAMIFQVYARYDDIISVPLVSIEHLAAETVLIGSYEGITFQAPVPTPKNLMPGEVIWLAIEMVRGYHFDHETGVTIILGDGKTAT